MRLLTHRDIAACLRRLAYERRLLGRDKGEDRVELLGALAEREGQDGVGTARVVDCDRVRARVVTTSIDDLRSVCPVPRACRDGICAKA